MEKPDKTTVFMVEDNEMFAEAIAIHLQDQGYTVHTFRSGEEMISSWEEDPDIILLDYFIDNPAGYAMNGNRILHFIRRINQSLPVIMLTSHSDIAEATALLKLGAVDYIIKDDDLRANLDKTMRQILETRQLLAEMAANRARMLKYRQRFLVIGLIIALAVVILLWLVK